MVKERETERLAIFSQKIYPLFVIISKRINEMIKQIKRLLLYGRVFGEVGNAFIPEWRGILSEKCLSQEDNAMSPSSRLEHGLHARSGDDCTSPEAITPKAGLAIL